MTTAKKSAKRAKATEQTAKQVNNTQTAEQPKTKKQQAAQTKREWLRNISAEFQAQRKILEMMGTDKIPTINEMLRTYYEKESHITELNTFDQWKEKGYQVRRGEKAFLFWGRPQNKQKTEEGDQGEEKTITKADDFYPICYLFDISQCYK